jgi:hypothetical protein
MIPGPRGYLTDGEKINVWHRRKSIAQRLRDPYETQWVDNWKSYRAFKDEMTDPRDWWRSNEFIPEIFNAVETILPRDVLGMFNRPEWFDINCPHAGIPGHPGLNCFDYERMVKSVLLSGTRRMNLFEPVFEGRKYGNIMGHVWWKLPWERTTCNRPVDVPVMDPSSGEVFMSRKIIPYVDYDDPKLEWVSNFKLWPDPTGQNEWFIEDIDTTLEKLDYLNKSLPQPIYKNLEELEAAPKDYAKERNSPAGVSAYGSRENEIMAVEGFDPTVKDEGHEGTPIKLEVCVGRVPYEPEDGIYWRRLVIANDNVIIRDDPNPTPDLKPEYFGSPQIPIPGMVYGDSYVRYAGPLNTQLNRLENFRMDEVVLNIWQQYIANRNAVGSQQLEFSPGGVIFVDTEQDVRTAFAVLERRPVMPEAYREAGVKVNQIQRTTGATATQQGDVPETQDRSATAFQGRLQLGNERFRLATMFQNMTFKRQLLKRMFALYQVNLPQDRLTRIVGTDYRVPIDISMLQDDIDIDIQADIYEVDGSVKQQAMAAFLNVAANPVFAQWWRTDELLRDSVEAALPSKDGRKYVKAPEEVAAEAQAQLFAAAAMGQLEPAGGAQGRGSDSQSRRSA